MLDNLRKRQNTKVRRYLVAPFLGYDRPQPILLEVGYLAFPGTTATYTASPVFVGFVFEVVPATVGFDVGGVSRSGPGH
jgi:hypothetical protein